MSSSASIHTGCTKKSFGYYIPNTFYLSALGFALVKAEVCRTLRALTALRVVLKQSPFLSKSSLDTGKKERKATIIIA